MVLDESSGELLGLVVTYVDDILYLGELYIINALHSFVVEKWPAMEWVNDKIAVRYLGVEILWEPGAKSFSISQAAYIADILCAHNLHNAHSTLLPVPREWVEAAEAELEDVEADISESALRSAQRAVGEALWLATKSRPDILFVVNHMASVASKRPAYVLRVSQRVLSYLSGTSNLKLMLGPRSDIPGELVCYTDASYAPFGQRSFGAAEPWKEVLWPGKRVDRVLSPSQLWRQNSTLLLKVVFCWSQFLQCLRKFALENTARFWLSTLQVQWSCAMEVLAVREPDI